MARLWVLGAADPEMAAIEQLLVGCGETVAYATAGGKRVHPGNAYGAVVPSVADGVDCVCTVECGWDVDPDLRTEYILEAVDHHRPGETVAYTFFVCTLCECSVDRKDTLRDTCPECGGAGDFREEARTRTVRPADPGYGRPPADYFAASSIGQVVTALCRLGVLTVDAGEDDEIVSYGVLRHVEVEADDLPASIPEYTALLSAETVRLIAAADHCLAAAYRGECPGVDPDTLMAHRVRVKAQFRFGQRCPHCGGNGGAVDGAESCHTSMTLAQCVASVMHSVDTARDVLRTRAVDGVADMTDRPLDELPEAAVREGLAYLATVRDRDGRQKDVLGGHTTPEMVTAWMASMRAAGREVYGDPARGFAGAYRS